MENIKIAAALLPLMNKLYAAGVLSVGTTSAGDIQLSSTLFHSVFSEWETVDDRHDEYVEHHNKLDGVDIFCLSWKGAERP